MIATAADILAQAIVGDGAEALLKTMREDTERWGRMMRETNYCGSE